MAWREFLMGAGMWAVFSSSARIHALQVGLRCVAAALAVAGTSRCQGSALVPADVVAVAGGRLARGTGGHWHQSARGESVA